MSMTHDYLDYLNEKVGISPANSQEELQAAQVISNLMGQHEVELSMEEFEAPALAGSGVVVLGIVMFLGVLVSGFGIVALSLLGFVLAAIPAALGLMRLFGHEVSLTLGPTAQSQNVVAVHRACGPLVTKGNRTIVVAAHYDSPRENFLLTTPIAPYIPLISKLTVPCRYVAAVCALLQVMGFIPAAARIVIWLVGIVATLPALVLAVGAIAERVSSCTLGANDNKSGVAALLGVLENVRPSGLVPRERPVVTEESLDETDSAEVTEDDDPTASTERTVVSAAARREEVLGVRHGEEALRSLGVLPETCEIEYVSAPAVAEVEEPVAEETAEAVVEDAPEDEQVSEEEVERILASDLSEETEPADDAEATQENLMSTARFSLVMDDGSRGIGPKDTSGLTNETDTYDPDETQPAPAAPRPEAPSDPEWGKSSYRPKLSSVARRASLFDLPDPSENEVDPLSTDPNATRVRPSQVRRPAPQEEPEPVAAPEPVETLSDAPSGEKPKKNPFSGLLGRLRKQVMPEGNDAPADDANDADDGVWRGGAATRSGLRLVEEDEAPREEELREAALSLGDDALVSHDIWFVALGGSSLDHAGMRAFLAEHRSEVRGCFVINLDCVGAGNLTILKNEGLELGRRADRRIARLLTGAAQDLHVELDQKPCDWQSTDATPAMRASLRSLTLRGLDENGLPALSHTAADVAENVSGDQVTKVTEIVTEMIRRS